MTNRRAFLRMAGVAPLAVKAAAESAVGSLSNIQVSGLADASSKRIGGTLRAGTEPVSAEDLSKKVLSFLAESGLPEWKEQEIRRRCDQVSHLDPDIANKRSWSMAVKVATQRNRNVARAMADIFESPIRNMDGQKFREKWGFWL